MGRGRRLETFEDYSRALKGKYGLGEGKDYKPWLRVQDVKSKGIRAQVLLRFMVGKPSEFTISYLR